MLGVENKKYIVLYEMAADDPESGNLGHICFNIDKSLD